jgi:hypothetical protein
VQTARDLHDQVIETQAQIAEGIGYKMKDLDPAQRVLNPKPALRNEGVEAFVRRRQCATFWLFLRLKGHDVSRLIALKAGVFPQLAAGREDKLLGIRQRFIMLFAGHGGAEHLDFAGPLVTDDVILDRGPFLLAAVVLALFVRVLRASYRTFGAIEDELQARTRGEHLFRRLRLPRRQLALVAQRLVQHRRQPMNPDVGLGSAQPEEIALHQLDGVMLEVEQDEHQLVVQRPERALASAAEASAPWRLPLSDHRVGICSRECPAELFKAPMAQAGKTLEQRRFVPV